MTQAIPLSAVPNQEFAVVLDGNNWDIAIRLTGGVMSVSMARDGAQVIENLRAVAGMRLIPSRYEEAGNFAFVTANHELPDYRLFGVSQSLLYAGPAELAAIRVPTPARITPSYFNPLAPLPLRFAPQGYALA